MNSKEKLEFIIDILKDKKALDIKVIDITDVSILCDYFIICTGTSKAHIRTLSDEVDEKTKDKGEKCASKEGYDSCDWVLLDFGDVVLNVFKADVREFYSLEKLWADGKIEER